MDTPLQLTYDHRIEEHLRARRLYESRKSKLLRADRIVGVLALLAAWFFIWQEGFGFWAILSLLCAAILLTNRILIEGPILRYRFRRTPQFQEKVTVTFHEDGIHFQTPTMDTRIQWNFYKEVVEDDQLFLLLYAPCQYTVIPKRAFPSAELCNAFADFARSHSVHTR